MRLRQIALAARDLDGPSADLADVLGLGAAYADPGVAIFGLRNAVHPVGDTFLEIVSPVKDTTAVGRFLDRRGGDGGYMVIVQSDDRAADLRRVNGLGIRVVWETELPDISTLHLHPRDVGGAILSLDVANPPESWRWAGRDWRERSRSDVSTALVAAELRAPDPAAMARCWSQVLDRPVREFAGGGCAIDLERGCIRFATACDENAAGLAGLDVAVRDPAAVRAAARRRGLECDGDAIRICGTEVRPVPA
ncbi:MAG: VOC family protein [Deltaproteobacteria bacterium]|nr:VOC family protein [Deltaproteobacteria bacterium]MBW2666631.1 VOC family protein [Deltaproteobacteria bacterium]